MTLPLHICATWRATLLQTNISVNDTHTMMYNQSCFSFCQVTLIFTCTQEYQTLPLCLELPERNNNWIVTLTLFFISTNLAVYCLSNFTLKPNYLYPRSIPTESKLKAKKENTPWGCYRLHLLKGTFPGCMLCQLNLCFVLLWFF